MAWRDELRPASFRGVSFYVEGGTLTFGRRLAIHEYPQREKPYVEDLGKKARVYRLEAFVLGPDYMKDRDALIDALETPGAGQLVHPYYGSLVVTVSSDIDVSETSQQGGMARISATFVEAGELNAPEVTEDTVAAVEEAERTFLDDLKDWFAETFDVSGLGDYVPDAAMDAISTLMEYENMALGALGWIRSAVSSDLKVLLPEVLASKLAAPSELAQGILMCINKAQVIGELADFKVPRIESENMNGEIRQRTNTNAYALEKLVAGAVVSRQIQEVAQLVPAAVEEAQAADPSAGKTGIETSAGTADTDKVFTLDDAAAARKEIVELVDTLLFDEEFGEEPRNSLLNLRDAVLAHLDGITPSIPSVRSVKVNRVLPAIVLAHRFYGDDWGEDGREDELCQRNGVRHPGFVPADKDLSVVVYE